MADVVVTAGGTSEPIDDVRVVSNSATGRFGLALARAARRRGHTPTLIGSELALAYAASELAGRDLVETARFGDSASLWDELVRAARPDTGQVVLHGAAVADFWPVRSAGKVSSDTETLLLELRRAPKLVDRLRETFGRDAFLVGFKLTSGATPQDCVAAARALCVRARLNMVVANDLSELHAGRHPVWLVTPEGGSLRVVGDRDSVADRILAFVDARRAVRWARTVVGAAGLDGPGPGGPGADESSAGLASRRWDVALEFAQAAALFDGPDGNIICRGDSSCAAGGRQVGSPGLLACSPRQVDKASLRPGDSLAVVVELYGDSPSAAGTPPGLSPGSVSFQSDGRLSAQVRVAGLVKPSIDTSVVARILACHPEVSSSVHFHGGWGRPDATTSFCFPCGAAEEAQAVSEALDAAGTSRAGWLVELVHHGFLLGADDDTMAVLSGQWARTLSAWRDHLADVALPRSAEVSFGRLRPVFDGASICGVVAPVGAYGSHGVAVHLDGSARGSGVGTVVASQLAARAVPVVTAEACGVVDWWESRGFVASKLSDDLWCAAPPVRPDVTDPVVEALG